MKKPVVLWLVGLMIPTLMVPSAFAQYRGARDYMKRLNPPAPPAQHSAPPPAPAPYQAVAPSRAYATNDPAKQAVEDIEKEKRVFEFQKEQAEAGSPRYQYEVGMRYWNGKGVDKDPVAARMWIEKSAKKGNEDAIKQLAEMKKLDPPSDSAPAKTNIAVSVSGTANAAAAKPKSSQ
jgi:TPR repeat protein